MPRYIDANALLARYKERCEGCKETKNYCEHCCDIADVISDIEDAPTIEEPKGKWIGKPIAGYCTVRCSVCKNVFRENNGRWNFCPTCGADMRGDGNDN